eukprot:4195538-Pleurochrysis_carterae.AAC.2
MRTDVCSSIIKLHASSRQGGSVARLCDIGPSSIRMSHEGCAFSRELDRDFAAQGAANKAPSALRFPLPVLPYAIARKYRVKDMIKSMSIRGRAMRAILSAAWGLLSRSREQQQPVICKWAALFSFVSVQ